MHRNVRDYGAVGDGVTRDTVAIQAALDAGGIVFFPPGVYCSGTIYLRSRGGLELSPGATLLASPDPADYNADDFCPQNRVCTQEIVSGRHLIAAVEVENVTIRGGGQIHGNDSAWFTEPDPSFGVTPPFLKRRPDRPGQMLFFCECRDVKLQDIELTGATYWHCFLHGCENVGIRGIRIRSGKQIINNDGIDIDCCCRVTVSDCIIETADDCLTLRGNPAPLKTPRACEYVTVSNCILSSDFANAIRIGVGCGEIRRCLFSNISISYSRTGICIVSRYTPASRGVDVSDIDFRSMQLHAQRPFRIKLDNSPCAEQPCDRTIRDIRFSGISGTAKLSSFLQGTAAGRLERISFRDVSFRYGGSGAAPDRDASGHWGCGSSDSVFDLSHARDLYFSGVNVAYEDDACGWKHDVAMSDCQGVAFERCGFPLGIEEKSSR